MAHALETHKTLSGNDVHAVIEGKQGDVLDGSVYHRAENLSLLESYHLSALKAHQEHRKPDMALPVLGKVSS